MGQLTQEQINVDLFDEVQRLKKQVCGLENSLKIYKRENETFEKSTYIEDFMYEPKVDNKGEIPILIKVHGVEHTLGITENDAKMFYQIFTDKNL
ncbi:hypothetical protein QT711_03450 [Sporosarcina saromensis]|uniref:Uncharacterized protein n=1 Tax=Sporosarcina saromensis TaxID=359365 RepID=A0ABU4G5P7_9BACL|nr:hypothetical protein [Sporosarcina saromensis]MDW0112226.1 hypothetical protein [Sporosarcina saromensis]